MMVKRQLGGFVKGDGVDDVSRPHNDATYVNALNCLEPILAARPFLLGERPTIADFGLMGPMFRHFSQDAGNHRSTLYLRSGHGTELRGHPQNER